MIGVNREMALADFEAKLDEYRKIPREHPSDVAAISRGPATGALAAWRTGSRQGW